MDCMRVFYFQCENWEAICNMKKRFLRDGVLDSILDEICSISEKVPDMDSAVVCSQSFATLVELYETNKIVLQYLEAVIDDMRGGASYETVLEKVVQAAAHMQIGCVSAHQTLQSLFDREDMIRSE